MRHATSPSVSFTVHASFERKLISNMNDPSSARGFFYTSALHRNIGMPYYFHYKVYAMQSHTHKGLQRSAILHPARALFPRRVLSSRPPLHAAEAQPMVTKSTAYNKTLASIGAQIARVGATKHTNGAGAGVQSRPSIWERVKEESGHYWDGTKLLGKEIKISAKLANRLLYGNQLTRREQRQLKRTTGDLLRLIPFSVFIIVPFMEFLLPFALKFFPSMLPSIFEDSLSREQKERKLLSMRLEMSRFLQETLGESAVPAGSDRAVALKEFGDFFRKLRTTGDQAPTDELLRVARLFTNEVTLDNLARPQLVSIARYMNLNTFGTDSLLRYQIRNSMNAIKKDDQLVMLEGIDSLTPNELLAVCQYRAIHTKGLSTPRLRNELAQWLDLHLTHTIPSSLLILSRAFSFSDSDIAGTPTLPIEALQATLSSLPDTLLVQTEFYASEPDGAATPSQKLEILEQQEELIADEKTQQERELNVKEMILDNQKMNAQEEKEEERGARSTAQRLLELHEALRIMPSRSEVREQCESQGRNKDDVEFIELSADTTTTTATTTTTGAGSQPRVSL
ncbi:LETM1-like protein-domain-containing protein [Gamsiella multidivaricata]|uniref:LETM1-like protein-domain-containing protein n=1 Tax=Gamsiella multidivaricata TaxID=101098 RepID=UPI002220097C|nr:LETM1-like protein-domain-containing protein [Gamsiella multidivaricata]KAI7818808.1 LETM1-like protein-domain-containing protein [Gamsiella multidivaricata]